MALLPKAQTLERKRIKDMAVLRFLRTSIYSNSEILGQVMGIADPSAIRKSLKKLEAANVLTHTTFDILGRFTIWGITATGQAMSMRDGDEPIATIFNASKVSLPNLTHYLQMQQIQVNAEKAGWHSFEYCDRTRRIKIARKAEQKRTTTRPDLIAKTPEGHTAAIECERFVKTAKRYMDHVLPAHIQRLNDKEYDFVVWVCPSPAQQQNLHQLITNCIVEMRESGNWKLEVKPNGFKTFQFGNVQTWPNQ
jgi:hypothetical protein